MAINRRLLFWLIRAYVQKWGKAIFAFFVLGLIIFFLLETVVFSFITKITSENKQIIGVIGSYTVDTLPPSILNLISRGLTFISPDGNVHPDLASSWQVKDDGRTYIFFLKKGEKFSDGTALTSQKITSSFTDVAIDRPNDYTITYHLKDSYAPFLVTASQPIFKDGFVGLGKYKVSNIILNGDFIQSITLTDINNGSNVRVYQFYPTDDALKLAFALGEISIAQGLSDISFQKSSFSSYPNAIVSRSIDYTTLVTLFYNTADKTLSDPKIREAFSYTIPNTLPEGQRAYTSISPLSWAYSNTNPHTQDFVHAKLLLEASLGTNIKDYPNITISTLPKYINLAKMIQVSWNKIGIKTQIITVNSVPSTFQVYLGDFNLPEDPDQYTLWHSYQPNNITNLNKDVRIDKLLEDGRKTLDQESRVKDYADFQKYLTNDQPATFLYFPYSYTIKRK